jgi:superfamily II RNA helicase
MSAWAKGAKFIELTEMTDEGEGNFFRTIHRTAGLLKNLESMALSLENTEMATRFEAA